MPSVTDTLMTSLAAAGQTVGSLADRSLAYLATKTGVRGSYADMSSALGKSPLPSRLEVVAGITPTMYQFSYADSNVSRMTEGLIVNPTTGAVAVIASAGRIWVLPNPIQASNTATQGTQLAVSGDVTGASWSPDGSKLAVVTRTENVYIFNSSFVQQQTFTAPAVAGNTEAICWALDGNSIYICYDTAAGTGSAVYNITIPGNVQTLVGTTEPALSQLSGLVMSRIHANVLYGILDFSSNGDTKVYAISAVNASTVASISLTGVTNFDWEDIDYYDGSLYVGDHGNYGGAAPLGRGTHQIYKFTEPSTLP